MSSLSIATTARSARWRCSAVAKASRSASAAAARSETRPPETAPSGTDASPRPTMRSRDSSRLPTTTWTAPAASSMPATVGPRGAIWRASREWIAGLTAVTSPAQTLADRQACRLDRLTQARGVLAAGRRALRAAAALPVDDALHLFHELVGVDGLDKILRNRDDKVGLAFSYATQDDDPRPDRGLHAVRQRTELLDVTLADVRGDDLRGTDDLGLSEQAGGRGLDTAALLRLELVLKLLARLGELRERLG